MMLASNIVMMHSRSQSRNCKHMVCMRFWALLLPITGHRTMLGADLRLSPQNHLASCHRANAHAMREGLQLQSSLLDS